jgi:hypothetical protein
MTGLYDGCRKGTDLKTTRSHHLYGWVFLSVRVGASTGL